MTSLIYRHELVYGALMRALYGRNYRARDQAVADQTPAGGSVVDLCCGPGTLYLHALKSRGHDYLGVDINARFLARLEAKGARTLERDLVADPRVPDGDVVIMQASLYHFLPDKVGRILDAMFAAARLRVVVSEPIRNLSRSRVGVLAKLAQSMTDPGAGEHRRRFDEASLDEAMTPYRARLRHAALIPGGREKLFVFDAAKGFEGAR
jgi:SAM-dependent methyltransferase